MGRGMSEHDIDILARNIQRKDLFEILFGQASFAVSFLSSEWRYRLNTLSENVEQTGTVAGYIKAIEQMMFDLLPLWANRDYKVAFGAVKAWNPAVPLTSASWRRRTKRQRWARLPIYLQATSTNTSTCASTILRLITSPFASSCSGGCGRSWTTPAMGSSISPTSTTWARLGNQGRGS